MSAVDRPAAAGVSARVTAVPTRVRAVVSARTITMRATTARLGFMDLPGGWGLGIGVGDWGMAASSTSDDRRSRPIPYPLPPTPLHQAVEVEERVVDRQEVCRGETGLGGVAAEGVRPHHRPG